MKINWKPTPIKEILYHTAVQRRPVLIRYVSANGRPREVVLASVSVNSRVEVNQTFDAFDLSTITEIRIISKQGHVSRLRDHEEFRLLILEDPLLDLCEAHLM